MKGQVVGWCYTPQMRIGEVNCCLTGDAPGIGGRLKERPEDFEVDEVALFEPAGTGDHLYLYVEKRSRGTSDVARLLARHFGVSRLAVGYAGLKDKQAVTRQWFSVEHADESRGASFDDDAVHVLDVARHTKKLKRGNLLANRFAIKVRGVDVGRAVTAKRVLDRLAREGVPNYFGEQRFGRMRNNQLLGRALILGDWRGFLDVMLGGVVAGEAEEAALARAAYGAGDYPEAMRRWHRGDRFERQALGALARGTGAERAVLAIDKSHRLLLVSAFQSALFNELLDARVREGNFSTLRAGDLAMLHATGGVFRVEDAAAEQPRCDRLEVSPTGPMWGVKMTRAGGVTGEAERRVLEASGVSEEELARGPAAPDGLRRSIRMLVEEPRVSAGADEHGPYVECRFTLGRGSFATVVMREVMKNISPEEDAEGVEGESAPGVT